MVQNNFTRNFQYLMHTKEINSVELANELSISPEAIIKLKKGELENPSLKIAIAISQYFEVPLEKLVFDNLN